MKYRTSSKKRDIADDEYVQKVDQIINKIDDLARIKINIIFLLYLTSYLSVDAIHFCRTIR